MKKPYLIAILIPVLLLQPALTFGLNIEPLQSTSPSVQFASLSPSPNSEVHAGIPLEVSGTLHYQNVGLVRVMSGYWAETVSPIIAPCSGWYITGTWAKNVTGDAGTVSFSFTTAPIPPENAGAEKMVIIATFADYSMWSQWMDSETYDVTATPLSMSATVSTDKSAYYPSDTVVFEGTVTGDGVVEGAQVSIKITGSVNGQNMEWYVGTTVDATGKYSKDFQTGSTMLGDYAVAVTVTKSGYQNALANTAFTIQTAPNVGSSLSGSVQDGHGHFLPYVKVTLNWNGKDLPSVYTNRTGEFAIYPNDPTFYAGSDKEGYLKVTLIDSKGTIAVYDEANDKNNPAYFNMLKFKYLTENDRSRKIIAPTGDQTQATSYIQATNSKPEFFDDLATTYYYTELAAIFAEEELKIVLDHKLPVEVMAFSNSVNTTCYDPSDSIIYITSDDTLYKNGKKLDSPDNVEFHEFGHHIMTESKIGLEDDYPGLAPGDDNHQGIDNSNSVDSMGEGFAEFMSMVMTHKMLMDKQPYKYHYGGTMDNLEENFQPHVVRPNSNSWKASDEEFAVAGVLWDLYDGANMYSWIGAPDDDKLTLTLDEIWQVLNNGLCMDVNGTYHVLKASNIITSKTDGVKHLNEIFISHGFYEDTNTSASYDDSEPVGTTLWNVKVPHRPDKPPRPGSYVLLDLTDEATGGNIAYCTLKFEVKFDAPFEYYGYSYVREVSGLPGIVPISMPPIQYPSELVITPIDYGYEGGTPFTLTNDVYWQNVGEQDYIAAHSFTFSSFSELSVGEHLLCKGVESDGTPIETTSTFTSTDQVFHVITLTKATIDDVVDWVFTSASGITREETYILDWEGEGYCYCMLNLGQFEPAEAEGDWTITVYVNDKWVITDYYTVQSNGNNAGGDQTIDLLPIAIGVTVAVVVVVVVLLLIRSRKSSPKLYSPPPPPPPPR